MRFTVSPIPKNLLYTYSLLFCLLSAYNSALGREYSTSFTTFSLFKIQPVPMEVGLFVDDEYTTTTVAHFESVLHEHQLDTAKLEQQVVLTRRDWTVLNAIIHPNKGAIKAETNQVVTDCYIPRHILVFYDEQNTIVGAIEICLECEKVRFLGICDAWNIRILPTGMQSLNQWISDKYNTQ